MDGPPLADGGVLIDGEGIVAVGTAASLRSDAVAERHVDGALLPGMVNAHAHLEYGDAFALATPRAWLDWVRALGLHVQPWDADRWSRSAHRGVQMALRGGAAVVGDVVTKGPAVPAAGAAGLHGDSWVEAAFVDWDHHDDLVAQIGRALDLPAHGRRVGIAPHAPYSIGTGVLQALAALARERGAPLHVHAAETRDEVEAIFSAQGPLADLARERGMAFEWLDGGAGMTPIHYLEACGALFPGASIAHGVWVDDDEAALLAERGTAVVLCPRSNAMLQVGEAPVERYARAGTALALGTDSEASCPDLDLLSEAAAWVRLASRRGLKEWPGPDGAVPLPEQAIRLVTVDGAAAMGWHQDGVLAAGRRANLVGVELETTASTVYRDLVTRGRGRIVLNVIAGVRKARRDRADADWAPIDRQEWRA
jgi:cytosine/adenosine deaminase-related metal-dependent hydrolase